MAVKVPPMLHKMSVAAQKAWYKKNKMEYPGAAGKEGKSAAQAKKDVGEINKKKAREAAIAAAAKASKKNKELVSSSERVRKMASLARAFGGERPGGDLTTNRGIVQYVRGGGTLRAGRLGEAAKPDASMVMTDTLKTKMITDKDKQTLGKIASLMTSQKNKDKKNAYVRKVGLDAMKAGKVDPARGHSPTRFGREELRKEEKMINPGLAKYADNKKEEPPFTPDKKKVRRGPGGPMSQARWLAQNALAKHMKAMKKEEVEQIDEMFGGKVNGKRFDYEADEHELEDDDKLHDAIASQNDHLHPHEVKAIVRSGGYSKHVVVGGKKHRVEHDDNAFNEEVEQIDELKKSTLASYVNKAVINRVSRQERDALNFARDTVDARDKKQLGKTRQFQGLSVKMSPAEREKNLHKAYNRDIGIKRAVGRLASEEVDLVVEQDDTMEKKEMAQTQLHFMKYAAEEILEFIKMGGEIEEWYQNKLSKVHSDVEGLHSYVEGEKRRVGMVEEVEQIDEADLEEGYEGKSNHKPGWMLKADPELAKKLKDKTDLAKKRQATYGDPAAGKSVKEALDPVGKEDADIDNDGDSDKTDVYLHRKRKAIGAAIKKKVAEKMGK